MSILSFSLGIDMLYNEFSKKLFLLTIFSCFVRLAEGFEVKRNREIEVGEISQYFPHFIWLLRDVSLKILDGGTGEEMDPTDYIKKKVFHFCVITCGNSKCVLVLCFEMRKMLGSRSFVSAFRTYIHRLYTYTYIHIYIHTYIHTLLCSSKRLFNTNLPEMVIIKLRLRLHI